MAMSGVKLSAEAKEIFQGMKKEHTHKYCAFKIEDKKEIVVDDAIKGALDPNQEKTKENDKEMYDQMKEKLVGANGPRYVLYDFNFRNKEGRKIEKLAFISW